jgi:excinuclease ABC subunit C
LSSKDKVIMMEDDDLPGQNQVFDSKAFIASLSSLPGVYQMLGSNDEVLYVGKAGNLKKRVGSYFHGSGLATKTQALVKRITHIQITITNSETEALLLEQNLIKKLHPPYNVLLRDDKSYPYIYISEQQEYPAIRFHRGAKRSRGRYFGPFPSSGAVRESLNLLQHIFQIRQCDEAFFKNRSRPCLQYQIKRCSAPCTRLISPDNYRDDIRRALMFLEGKSSEIKDELARAMEQAAQTLDYEKAAVFRDQIVNLQKVQEQQHVTGISGDADILAARIEAGVAAVHQLFVKGGRIIGSKTHHPKLVMETTEEELLSAFIGQYYLLGGKERQLPKLIIASHVPEDKACLEQALTSKRSGKVEITANVRGDRLAWLKLCAVNAQQQLSSYIANKQNVYLRFVDLQEVMGLESLPQRMECFDISHSSGEATVASCVVFDIQGPVKSAYRRFNIEGVVAGDDYGAMRQALKRRYARVKRGEVKMPDILVVDGGKGQLSQAMDVLDELQIEGIITLGVAKGVTRKAGMESLFIGGQDEELVISPDSGALHLIQHIRDEAHRFAITGHRQRRGKSRNRSLLENIPGVGAKRRKALLQYFGGIQEIQRASVEEIAKVSTISRSMAEEIYDYLRNS